MARQIEFPPLGNSTHYIEISTSIKPGLLLSRQKIERVSPTCGEFVNRFVCPVVVKNSGLGLLCVIQ
jgi:hypothetical protein